MKYTNNFFKAQQDGSQQSAEIIVPYLIDLISPTSVVDFGCGVGTWLSVFKKYRIEKILGIDGSYVDKNLLRISKNEFIAKDLNKIAKLDKRFDMSISLEVGEHLSPKSSDKLVKSLVNAADVVYFSAAIPHQGGVGHINEQWQSYWCNLFLNEKYLKVDAIRLKFWNDERVKPWYVQNSFIYVKKTRINIYPKLRKIINNTELPTNIVHPKIHENRFATKEMIIKAIKDKIFKHVKV